MSATARHANPLTRAPRSAAAGILRAYKFVFSPMIAALFGPACRFEPTCSAYAAAAIAEHGLIRGGAMAFARFIRCNPLGGHGHDPVPMRDRP
jgi:uncharacterized protein